MSLSRRAAARIGALAVAGAVFFGSDAAGQTVELRRGNRGLARADGVLTRVLERGTYQVFVRDTILAADDVIEGDVILLKATLRVEGTIEGDLVAVESDVFTRPGARIRGAVVVLNGGFYGSTLAELSSPPIDGSVLDYRVEAPEEGRYRVVAPGGRAVVHLPGIKGFLLPTYDRVNAVTFVWGAGVERGGSVWAPNATARFRYRTARGKLDGNLTLEWPFQRHSFWIGAGRTVRSNDLWIQNDPENSVSSLVLSADYRNYYDAKYIEGGVRLEHGTGAIWSYGATFSFENARSLDNQDPFSIFTYREDFRANPSIDDGEIGSLRLEAALEAWPRPLSLLEARVNFEAADADIAGDFSFTLFSGSLRADLPTFGAHKLELRAEGHTQGGSDSREQRWRAIGGWRTLPTLQRLERRGDRLWWVEAIYTVPTRRRLGLLGALLPWVSYGAGNAWEAGTPRPGVSHNLGAGLNFGLVGVGVYTDPSDDFETVVAIGVARSS